MTNANIAAVLHALLGAITPHDMNNLIQRLKRQEELQLNGSIQEQAHATADTLRACELAVNNMVPGDRARIANLLAQRLLPRGVLPMDEDQRLTLRGIERRLHAGSDKMRDEGHKLWLVLNQIEGK